VPAAPGYRSAARMPRPAQRHGGREKAPGVSFLNSITRQYYYQFLKLYSAPNTSLKKDTAAILYALR